MYKLTNRTWKKLAVVFCAAPIVIGLWLLLATALFEVAQKHPTSAIITILVIMWGIVSIGIWHTFFEDEL